MANRRAGLLVLDAERAEWSERGRLPEAWRNFLATVATFSPIDALTLVRRERDFEALAATAAAMNDSLGLALALSAPSVYRRFEAEDERCGGSTGGCRTDAGAGSAADATYPAWSDESARAERWAEWSERLWRRAGRHRRGRTATWSEVAAERSAIVCFEAEGESLAVQAATTSGCPVWRAPRLGCEGPVRQIVVWDDLGPTGATEMLKEAAAALADRYQTTWRIERPAPVSWWRRATGRSASCGGTFEADEWVVCASAPAGWLGRRRTRRRLARLLSGCSGPVLILPVGERLTTAEGVSARAAAGAE